MAAFHRPHLRFWFSPEIGTLLGPAIGHHAGNCRIILLHELPADVQERFERFRALAIAQNPREDVVLESDFVLVFAFRIMLHDARQIESRFDFRNVLHAFILEECYALPT
jgi:hypothetical protein